MQWEVADWNTRAAKFYKRVGGVMLREWLKMRMIQPALGKFAIGEVSIDDASSKS